MSDFDVFDDSDRLPPEHLIDELESIKDILHCEDNDTELPADIQLLDDMVLNDLNANAGLLNLNRIFDEGNEEQSEAECDEECEQDCHAAPNPSPTAIAPHAELSFPRFHLDTMLVDEESEPIASTISTAALIKNATSPPPSPQKTASASPRIRPDYRRDVLIQELVDEFVPQIEAALRERLSHLDDAALQQWKDRD